ncbi:MAG TPA: hypothetical protein VNY84_02930 [Acidimicrobiales bacterium]|nr:hypothetical protein [Acidimicrobiales bacterium]
MFDVGQVLLPGEAVLAQAAVRYSRRAAGARSGSLLRVRKALGWVWATDRRLIVGIPKGTTQWFFFERDQSQFVASGTSLQVVARATGVTVVLDFDSAEQRLGIEMATHQSTVAAVVASTGLPDLPPNLSPEEQVRWLSGQRDEGKISQEDFDTAAIRILGQTWR